MLQCDKCGLMSAKGPFTGCGGTNNEDRDLDLLYTLLQTLNYNGNTSTSTDLSSQIKPQPTIKQLVLACPKFLGSLFIKKIHSRQHIVSHACNMSFNV